MNRVLLIIPIYNGARYLPHTFSVLENLHIETLRIVYVNDGSTDETGQILTQYEGPLQKTSEVLTLTENKGKGNALCEAVKKYASHYDIICFTDVDIPYGITAVEEAIKNCVQMDITTGFRVMDHEHKQYSGYRYIANRLFRLFIPKEIRRFKDTQCGLKACKSQVAEDIFNSIKTFRWTFDLEIFVIAQIRGYTIREIPVSIHSASIERKGGISFFKDGWQILRDVYRIRRNMKAHRYEK